MTERLTGDAAVAAFASVRTVHEAEVSWWWTTERLHDTKYHIEVADSMDRKVAELTKKYDVTDDRQYCCQFEGRQLLSENLDQVTAAINELARHLARFSGIQPL